MIAQALAGALRTDRIKKSKQLKDFFSQLQFQMSLFKAQACVAGFFRDQLIGILFLGRKLNNNKFSSEELGFLSILASDVVMAIQNAWLFEDLRAQAERNKALFFNSVRVLTQAIEAKDLKCSVFTYYLVEGLAGQADDNKDGVVVLTELSTYVDSHVADEARVRGGIQRPVLRMDNVTEPSRFVLTFDPEGLIRASKKKAEDQKRIQSDLRFLRKLYFDKKITPEQFRLGQRLIQKDDSLLSKADRKRKLEFQYVIDGDLAPDKLKMALDVIQDMPVLEKPEPLSEKKKESPSIDSIIEHKLSNSISNARSILEKMKALINEEDKL